MLVVVAAAGGEESAGEEEAVCGWGRLEYCGPPSPGFLWL